MKRLTNKIQWILARPTITGSATLAGTILGLIAALRSDDTYIRIAGIVVALFAGLSVIYIWRRYILLAAKWLTWKFGLGLIMGAIIVVLLYPYFEPVIQKATHLGPAKQVEFTHSEPASNSVLESVTDDIKIFFSEEMSRSQRSSFNVFITPSYPIEWYWLISDYSKDTRELNINPGKYYPNERIPRFEHAMEYKVVVTGELLKDNVVVIFSTPDEKGQK